MSPTLLRLVLRLYPFDWRERYGAEVVALIEDEGLTWRTFPNLLQGAVAEWIALASSPDRRRVWLVRPSGRRLFASVAVLAPIAVMVLSALVAEALVPLVSDDSWVMLAAAGLNIVILPVAMWRFVFVNVAKTWSVSTSWFLFERRKDVVVLPTGPVGAERRFWFVVLLAMQLANQSMFVRSVRILPWPADWIQAISLLGYFTLPTSFLLTLSLQSAAQRFEHATGVPLYQPRRKPSAPPHPLGL